MTEVQQVIPWYERPIKTRTSIYGAPLTLVENGDNQSDRLPERHYWPDIESQRSDILELQFLEGQLAYEKAMSAFHDAITDAYVPLILPSMGAEDESDASQG